jgi:hypothetical protein
MNIKYLGPNSLSNTKMLPEHHLVFELILSHHAHGHEMNDIDDSKYILAKLS